MLYYNFLDPCGPPYICAGRQGKVESSIEATDSVTAATFLYLYLKSKSRKLNKFGWNLCQDDKEWQEIPTKAKRLHCFHESCCLYICPNGIVPGKGVKTSVSTWVSCLHRCRSSDSADKYQRRLQSHGGWMLIVLVPTAEKSQMFVGLSSSVRRVWVMFTDYVRQVFVSHPVISQFEF